VTADATGDVEFEIDVEALRRKYAEERAKRLPRAQYQFYPELKGKFADFDHDPYADAGFTRMAIVEDVDALVIGGGIAGLAMASRLREKGIRNLRIIEKGGDFGGTWYWNRYPGAACDVESYIYLPMLEETGYIPTEKYAKATEIQAYLLRLAGHFELDSAALFQTTVTELRWNEERKRWLVRTSRGDEISARFVISCAGFLSNPKLPKIPGIETFKGHSFHTSRWDYAYTGGNQASGEMPALHDKTLAIIGTGSTAIQSIPHLARWAKRLYVFQRTPSSIDPRGNRPTSPAWAKALKPGWQRARSDNFTSIMSGGREPEDLVNDSWTDILRHIPVPAGGATDPATLKEMQLAGLKKMEMTRRRIERAIGNKQTALALKPWYDYFCKRPGFSDEYLEAFNRPNVALIDTDGQGVERITPSGVVVQGKEYAVDGIVYATGFDFLMEFTREAGLEAYGRGGVKLSEHWKEGPRTLFGMQTDHFPNLFFIRVAQAGASFNYTQTVEEQSAYISHVINHCMSSGAAVVEAWSAAVDDWVAEVVAKAGPRQTMLQACTPSYYNYDGSPERARFSLLNELYGDGPLPYFRMLRQMRQAADLKGLTWS
jgi:cyclohexanone monooxygenase